MKHTLMSRRAFVAAAPAVMTAAQLSANDRVRVGIIGTGGRGQHLTREVEKCRDLNVTISAVCDIWKTNLDRVAAMVQKIWGELPRQTVDYEELLGWDDVDAVLISAPDFLHSRMLKAAVEAGKDAYCEKPMGTKFSEAKAAYQAVKRSDRVVQIGTQRRSEGQYIAAARMMRSGILGKVTRVETSVNFYQPRWRRDFDDVAESDVDWRRFSADEPNRGFDAQRLRQWQLYRAYTNGIPGLWMSHYIDLVPWFLGSPYPSGAVVNGGVFLWKDGRETYDVFHALLDYPNDLLVGFAMSLTNSEGNRNHWHGTRGTLDMDKFTISGAGASAEDRIENVIQIEPEEANSHMANFIECIRGRQQPRADIQAGFSHAVAGCLCAEARDAGKRARFDAERLEIVT